MDISKRGMEDGCELCNGNNGFHQRAKNQIHKAIKREIECAVDELKQLTAVFKDILWYSFETNCRNWGPPWRPTNSHATLTLHGYRATKHMHHGRIHWKGEFPVWWSGRVHEAIPIPPNILTSDIVEAESYVSYLQERLMDCYTYAPGGSEYEKLRRSTAVPTSISNTDK